VIWISFWRRRGRRSCAPRMRCSYSTRSWWSSICSLLDPARHVRVVRRAVGRALLSSYHFVLLMQYERFERRIYLL
jgi:hypothetical protein